MVSDFTVDLDLEKIERERREDLVVVLSSKIQEKAVDKVQPSLPKENTEN